MIAADRSAAAGKLADQATVAGIVALVLTPVLLILLGLWLARVVADPLRQTVVAASAVAAGNFDVRLNDRRRDEFGELAHVFNAMTESLAASRSELIERAESLAQSERHKSELISMVSHEVRTPLASVLGFTRLLLERDLPEADRQRYLEIVDAEATRLAALVSDFLDARLIEEGRFALRREPFDLRSLVREQAEVTLGHDESHELELELPDEPLRIDGDRARLAQVVGNVLSNAVKYSPDGGTITVGAAEASGHARVWVADEGTGIAPEHRGQLFEPFYRGDAAAAGIPGTGLGLAVSRRIVEAHDGRIGFDPLDPRHPFLVRPAARGGGERPPVSEASDGPGARRARRRRSSCSRASSASSPARPRTTATCGFAGHGSHAQLLGVFRVSILLNVVHLLVGAIAIVSTRRATALGVARAVAARRARRGRVALPRHGRQLAALRARRSCCSARRRSRAASRPGRGDRLALLCAARISPTISSAISAGVSPPRSSPTGPRTSSAIAPSFSAPLLLRAARAERADVERAALDASRQRRDVDALLVHERDERRLGVDVDLVRPRDDDLVRARHALAVREPGARIDDDRAPAERLRERAQRLGDVAGADRDEPRRRPDRFGEDVLAEPGLHALGAPSSGRPASSPSTTT